jgi:hypothetical protein
VFAATLLASGVALFQGREASARVAYDSPYTFEQTFGTAIRLIRVDLACKVTEKDADNGYVLFDYTSSESGNKVHRGSLEVVRASQGAHVSVQLSTLPAYHEQMIVDALSRKLVAEHGDPPPHDKAAPPPPPADDAGADGGT